MALVMAHVELAKAEMSAIGGEVARVAGLVGGAIVLVLFAVSLLVIGGSLFLAEWLFGSMGWGIVHGMLLFVGLAVAFGLSAVGIRVGRLGRSAFVALLIGVLTAIVLGLNMPNQLYTLIGDAALPGVEAGVRPLVVGLLIWAGIGLLVGIAAAFRLRDAGSRIAALLGLTLVGALFGAFTAITFGGQVGIALGVTAAYLSWIILMAVDASRTGIDVEGLQARFTPTQTIEISKETLEWLKRRLPGSGS
jgi:hypothetical protein